MEKTLCRLCEHRHWAYEPHVFEGETPKKTVATAEKVVVTSVVAAPVVVTKRDRKADRHKDKVGRLEYARNKMRELRRRRALSV